MLFRKSTARGQISAAELRRAGELIQSGRPMLGGGASVHFGTNGTAIMPAYNEIFLAEITAVSGTGTGATYSFTEQTAPPTSGGTEDRTSARWADNTKNPAYYVGTGTLSVGDVVLVRRHLANVNAYEILVRVSGTGVIVRGVLDGAMSAGGSATVSVWAVSGGTDADTTANVTAYDWLLATGESLAAGTKVVISFDAASDRWYVVNAECQS